MDCIIVSAEKGKIVGVVKPEPGEALYFDSDVPTRPLKGEPASKGLNVVIGFPGSRKAASPKPL